MEIVVSAAALEEHLKSLPCYSCRAHLYLHKVPRAPVDEMEACRSRFQRSGTHDVFPDRRQHPSWPDRTLADLCKASRLAMAVWSLVRLHRVAMTPSLLYSVQAEHHSRAGTEVENCRCVFSAFCVLCDSCPAEEHPRAIGLPLTFTCHQEHRCLPGTLVCSGSAT